MFDADAPRGDDSPLSFATAVRDQGILAAVDEAIGLRRVLLAFQPVAPAAGSGPPAFWEGLIRIMDGAGRIVPAADFVGRIERSETGRRVDALAIELGLAALGADPALRLSVNLGAHSIGYRPFTAALEKGLAADPSVAQRLLLEIDERSALSTWEVLRPFMAELQDRGVCFALDGFGAGATDVARLVALDFDLAKIGVRGIAADPPARLAASALMDVARRLGMVIVAQGIESEADAGAARSLGADCLQGYHLGPPVLERPIASGRRRAA